MEPDPAADRAALLVSLRAHEPADGKEERDLAAILALVEGAPGCFSRSHFVPGHVTASAFVVDPGSGRVLLHHHRRLDRWLQMGGHLDPGETPLAAAYREAREESGLSRLEPLGDRLLDVDVHPIPAGKGEPDHSHFDLRWAVAAVEPDAISADPAESIALRWFGLDEATGAVGDPSSIRALRRLASLGVLR